MSRVNEEWFSSNYDKIRSAVGLVDETPTPSTSQVQGVGVGVGDRRACGCQYRGAGGLRQVDEGACFGALG